MKNVIDFLTSKGLKVISQSVGAVTASNANIIISIAQVSENNFKIVKTFKIDGYTEFDSGYTFEDIKLQF